MLRVLWQLAAGYRLRPWRSPYLRWRIETYWGLHAEEIDCRTFWRFAWEHRQELHRYLQWAAARGLQQDRHNTATAGSKAVSSQDWLSTKEE